MFVGEGGKRTEPFLVCEQKASQNILKFFSNLYYNDAPRLRAIVLFLLSSPILVPLFLFSVSPLARCFYVVGRCASCNRVLRILARLRKIFAPIRG